MLETRFEDDMAEISGGGYLLLCAGRQRVFMEGAPGGPLPLSDVVSFAASDGALVVQTAGGDVHCPFDAATSDDLGPISERLNACLAAWR